MNQFLAEFYGTGGGVTKEASEAPITDADALEKMAQLTLLVKQAEDEGVDISGLSDEEALQLAGEMYGNDEPEPTDPGEQTDTDEVEKEAQAKFEEADFLGRVMAHANWQETQEILKEAGIKDKAVAVGNFLKNKATQAGSAVAGAARTARGATTGKINEAVQKKYTSHVLGNAKPTSGAKKEIEGKARRLGLAAELGTVGAGAAALGGAGYGVHKGVQAIRGGGKEKKSALDTLIEQRAIEHLAAAGYVDQQGNVYAPAQQEQEKTANDFQAQIDQAALQLLEQNGYPVEWNR
jgi:hypothetical protein